MGRMTTRSQTKSLPKQRVPPVKAVPPPPKYPPWAHAVLSSVRHKAVTRYLHDIVGASDDRHINVRMPSGSVKRIERHEATVVGAVTSRTEVNADEMAEVLRTRLNGPFYISFFTSEGHLRDMYAETYGESSGAILRLIDMEINEIRCCMKSRVVRVLLSTGENIAVTPATYKTIVQYAVPS